MSRALEKDIHQFMRFLADTGSEDARLYMQWWRTTRHWINQIKLTTHGTIQERDHAQRHYIKAAEGASRALQVLEEKGALKHAP